MSKMTAKSTFGSRSWREAEFYLSNFTNDEISWMNEISRCNIKEQPIIKIDELMRECLVNKEREGRLEGVIFLDGVSLFIKKAKDTFETKYQLIDESFQWLKKEKRACAFCFNLLNSEGLSYFSNVITDELNSHEPFLHRKGTIERSFYTHSIKNLNRIINIPLNNLMENVSIHDHESRFDLIVTSFKYCEVDLEGQLQIMKFLSNSWADTLENENTVKLYKWFDNNDLQVEWLFQYLRKQIYSFALPWKTINNEELYIALQAYFDYQFLVDPLKTESLFLKIRPAWNQRKHQNKNEGTKSRGISMTERTNKRLDWLASHNDKKINVLIKELIDKEFTLTGGPSKL